MTHPTKKSAPPTDNPPSELALYLAKIEHQAKAQVTPTSADELDDPQVLHRRAENLLVELERERAEQAPAASLLLSIPETKLLWPEVLSPLLDRSRVAVAACQVKNTGAANAPVTPTVAPPVKVEPLIEVLKSAEGIRDRVQQACSGTDPRSEAAIARREAIFGRPAYSASRPALVNELRSIIAAIETEGPHQTPALRALVPQIKVVLKELEGVVPQAGGRPVKKARWSEQVVEAHFAIGIVVDELVQWAAAVASPGRNAAILRIAKPKRRSDEAATPAAPPKSEPKTDAPPGETGGAAGTEAPAPKK